MSSLTVQKIGILITYKNFLFRKHNYFCLSILYRYLLYRQHKYDRGNKHVPVKLIVITIDIREYLIPPISL